MPENDRRPPERRADIFDKILSLRPFRKLSPFFESHREGLLYLFFGVLTTAVSWGSFLFFHSLLLWNEHPANIAAWVIAVLFAFFTNRRWVFTAEEAGGGHFLLQLLSFYAGRLSTLGVQELLLLIFSTLLSLPAIPVRAVCEVVVLLLNYFVSKFFIFRKNK